jgi:hypothetical protein
MIYKFMLNTDINDIKKDLQRTNKAVVAIGCSFVVGSELSDDEQVKNDLTFLNILCKSYLKNQYTPINFGQEAAGNYAAISRLFLYDIPWKSLDELIVIFMPTGMQRFDIIKDENNLGVGNEFRTVWPFYRQPRRANDQYWVGMCEGYENTCYSSRFEVLNTILNFQILNSWVSDNNAKLIVFPAFNNEYNKEYFKDVLSQELSRSTKNFLKEPKVTTLNHYNYDFLVNSVPWDKFITIDNSSSFFEMCFRRDRNYNPKHSMYDVINKQLQFNNDWIMPRGHPSVHGHRFLAGKLGKILAC